MDKIISKGQLPFGIAIVAYGVEDLICAHSGTTVPGVPWLPLTSFWGYVTSIVLIAADLSLMVNFQARSVTILLGILFLFYVLLLEAPQVVARPMSISVRTVFFETLAMCALAFTLAAARPTVGSRRS